MLLKEPLRTGKRKADSEPVDTAIDLAECKLWTVCYGIYQQNITESTEKGAHLRDLLSVAANLVRRVLLKWPRSAVAAFDSAGVSFLIAQMDSLVATVGGQNQLLAAAPDMALLLHASRTEGSEYEEMYQLLAGVASRPWLSAGLKMADLRLGRWQQPFTKNSQLEEEEGEIISQSLLTLSLLKKEVCPKWRLAVMKYSLKSHGEKIVR
jgi:hypothetical protein